MPSVSGEALQRRVSLRTGSSRRARFLCPRCRARLCNSQLSQYAIGNAPFVSMPSVSGETLQHTRYVRVYRGDFVSMPSVSARLCNLTMHGMTLRGTVSMPSVSGEALQHFARSPREHNVQEFLCPRCRARLCNFGVYLEHARKVPVSMPSVSGEALQRVFRIESVTLGGQTFLCPRCRARLCNSSVRRGTEDVLRWFLCPRCRARLCNNAACPLLLRALGSGFYALGVGRGFAT